MLTNAIQNHAATLKRGLGLFLVVFIFYGTTVEAAHRHGRILPSTNATVLTDSDETATPLGSKVGCSDCLICQLHQNFSTTLTAFRIEEPPSQTRIKPATALARDVLSQMTGPLAGRAPPSIS